MVHPTYDKIFAKAHPYSLLSWAQGYTLFQRAREVPLEGDFAELGVYRGGSALILGLSDPDRVLHLFDTFQGHPDLHNADHDRPGSHLVGTLGDTNAAAVVELLKEHGVERGQCWVGTFPYAVDVSLMSRFALVHVDVDLWASATAALHIFPDKLVPGGVLVMDDYHTDECPGVLEAVEAWARLHQTEYIIERTAYPTYQAVIVKCP